MIDIGFAIFIPWSRHHLNSPVCLVGSKNEIRGLKAAAQSIIACISPDDSATPWVASQSAGAVMYPTTREERSALVEVPEF